jgi:SAM-dependent methyltransferase
MVRRPTSSLTRREDGKADLGAATSDRLQIAAQVFAGSSASLLETLPVGHPTAVLDLGCGPGHSTKLLAERFTSAEVTGVDVSAGYLADAAMLVPTARFVRHDVTTMPLPRAPLELVYGRMVLAELDRPVELVESWSSQLVERGWLVLEDLEWVRADDPAFLSYLELAATTLRAQGRELYAGQLLAAMAPPRGTAVVRAAVSTVTPTAAQSAAMFMLDLAARREQVLSRGLRTEQELDEVEAALAPFLRDTRRSVVTWGVRQMALRRWGGR